jgi:hypothetical protein
VCLCFWQYEIEGLTILSILQILILKACRLYYVGSRANHGIYAQFMAQSAFANKGCKVGLLRGAGTQMALWFYAMMRLLYLKQPLMATIHQQRFVHLNLNDSVRAAVQDINGDKFWKCIYFYFVRFSLLSDCFVTAIKASRQWIKYSSYPTGLHSP